MFHPSIKQAGSFRWVWFALVAILTARAAVADERPGETIYKKLCASCHGAGGEGSDEYPTLLVGTRSVAQLAKFIDKRMPEDDPSQCVGEDAERVAQYIYDTFYSPLAQERNRPARIELSRLTVKQFRHSVADLVGSFRPIARPNEERGLRGEYFKSRQFRDNERVLDRRDDQVQFDFGEAAPDPEKFDPHQFSIRWTGSVMAPDTGEYEFIVRTEHATRLWINDLDSPLIDAYVKSRGETHFRASIFLIAGRYYPLRLEFSKAKQGVDDSKKNKDKPAVKASIALEWKRPQLAPEVIAGRFLSPHRASESLVVLTPFPPDDRSIGYERGTSISKAWEESTTEAAIAVANYVVEHLRELSKVPDDAPDRPGKLQEFCRQFAERAFRRPISDELKQRFIDQQFQSAPDANTAVKRVVLLVLKSPRFLYREVGGAEFDSYHVASRLSFGLWDSLPDDELLQAAGRGQLMNRDQVVQQAERMATDPRARAKIHDFLMQWLKIEQVPDLAKNAERFPGFDEQAASDLRTSLELFLDEIVWGPTSDFRQLLLADSVYLNGRLAALYGADLPNEATFQAVSPKPAERAGVLTHPYLMAIFAYTDTTSPIHRGVFIARSVLGRSLRPPPEAFTPFPPELHPELTTRERVALQTSPDACTKCHNMINPLGFTLENFDAIGRFRDKEKDRPIDSSGSYLTRSGELVAFGGVRDLAKFLASSDETHAAFVEQMFQHLVKQPILAYGPETPLSLQQAFAKHEFSIRKLMVEIMAASALTRS